ncbi:MAG: PAS domain S-box protein [Planctomycetota bacterium]
MATIQGSDETSRLATLIRYQILDTDPEQLYDDFTQLAAHICEVPISLISLVDEQRQWFKSRVGIDAEETPREFAFCAHAIRSPDEILVVQNALEDERFANNPLVTGAPHIRSYAGAPLVTKEGYALGTLCVIDREPRQLTDDQLSALRMLARQVVSQLDAHLNLKLLNEAARQLEEERRDAELILDHVPAYLYFKDKQNNILRLNRAAAATIGLDRSEIEGRPAVEFYPDNAEKFYEDDLAVIASKQPKLGYVQLLKPDNGEPRWIMTDKIPIPDEQGGIKGLLVVASDITALKTTEDSLRLSQTKLSQTNANLEQLVLQKTQQLASSQEMYEDLYQNAPDMHVSVDPRDGSVIKCNQTLLNETGYAAEEVVGKPVFNLYHRDSHEDARKAFEEFRTVGVVNNRELVLARKDGSAIDVSLVVASVRDESGQIVASRSVWRDITEKKRMEGEMQRNMDRLAHLSRVATMNETATGIAHELNQPLQAIKNYAQGALLRLKNDNFEMSSLPALFEEIVGDADRAAELIASFRRFIKPSAKATISIAPTELSTRLSRLITREVAQGVGKISIDVADNLPNISCDSVQIKQVLLNLILNARDAYAEASLDDEEIRLVIEPGAEDFIRFSVIDRGPGLADVDAEKMFDAFYTTKETGLGVGLAICRTIVESHGSTLTATDNEGPGLTMSFELPIDVAAETET